jgi:hypothetical protein
LLLLHMMLLLLLKHRRILFRHATLTVSSGMILSSRS